MAKHIVDQPRQRSEGTRAREYARIERTRGLEGPHPITANLQRRPAEMPNDSRRTEEFMRRERERRG